MKRDQILDNGLALAEVQGLRSLSRNSVAKEAQVSGSLVVYYFGGTESLRQAVLRYAVEQGNEVVVCEGIMAGLIERAPRELCTQICARIMDCASGAAKRKTT